MASVVDTKTVADATTNEKSTGPVVSTQQFKDAVTDILSEYFQSLDIEEVKRRLEELNEPSLFYEFFKQAIIYSLEKHNDERHAVSVLLSEFYQQSTDIEKAFVLVLNRLPDLILDIPNAVVLVGNFIARSIADDVLPPSFLEIKDFGTMQLESVNRARSLLSGKGAGIRAANVWGTYAEKRSVKTLKKALLAILQEFLVDGGDIEEVERSLRELNIPALHFQFVKNLIFLAIEKHESDREALLTLLNSFEKSQFLTEEHIKMGFQIAVDRIADITKDVPKAKDILISFLEQATFLSASFVEEAKEAIPRNLQQAN